MKMFWCCCSTAWRKADTFGESETRQIGGNSLCAWPPKAVTRRVLAAKTEFYRTVFAPLDDAFLQKLFKAAQNILAFEATMSARRSDRYRRVPAE